MRAEMWNLLHGRVRVKKDDITLQEVIDKLDGLDELTKVDGNIMAVMYKG